MASNAMRANLGFLGGYSLFTGVIAALGTHPMRALHALTARTLLYDDGWRDLVRVARALLPLGGTSFRNCHWRLVGV